MRWFAANVKWIMILSGVLTCTMFYAAVAPEAALKSTFGESLTGPLAEIIVRNWGALIGLIGVLLIWAAYVPPSRAIALTIAGISKLVFIGLILSLGSQFMCQQAGIAVITDSVMVILYALCLAAMRSSQSLSKEPV